MKMDPDGLRAARALINISQKELADRIGMSRSKISRYEDRKIEKPGGRPTGLSQKNIEKIISYFKDRGVRFTEYGGAEWIPENEVRTLHGVAGFKALMDEVYMHAKQVGGPIEILNGAPDLFLKWLGEEWYARHAARMLDVKDNIEFRIIVDEEEQQLIASDFARYRRISKEEFNTQTIYIYGDNIAIFTFSDHDLDIKVFQGAGLVQTLRLLFDMFWEKAT